MTPESASTLLEMMNSFDKLNDNTFINILNSYFTKIVSSTPLLNRITTQISDNFVLTLSKTKLSTLQKVVKGTIKRETFPYKFQKFFSTWHNNIVTLNNSNTINNTFPSSCILETSRYKKEKEELKECTFRPIINTSTSTSIRKKNRNGQNNTLTQSNNTSVYERLYTDFVKMNLMKDMKRNETDKQIGESISFSPHMYTTPKIYALKVSKSFTERLEKFTNKKKEKEDRITRIMEHQRKEECTFNPRLNNNRKNLSQRKQLRDNLKKQAELENEKLNKKQKRAVDLNRIQTLYNTYKLKKQKIHSIQTEMEIENGITFQPFFYTTYSSVDHKYKAKLEKFNERNKKFIENKNNFVSQSKESQFEYQKPRKVYSPKEKETIMQNIINRLYKNGLEKQLIRNDAITMRYLKTEGEHNDNTEQKLE